MPATTSDDREAGGADQVADAAAAGLRGGMGAFGFTALLAQLALGLRHFGCSFLGSGGVSGCGGLRQGRRRPIPRGAGEAKELRGRRRRAAGDGEFDEVMQPWGELVDQLARGGKDVQGDREQRAGRGPERGELEPAAAEQRAAAEELGQDRLAAADGVHAGRGDDPEQRGRAAPLAIRPTSAAIAAV